MSEKFVASCLRGGITLNYSRKMQRKYRWAVRSTTHRWVSLPLPLTDNSAAPPPQAHSMALQW